MQIKQQVKIVQLYPHLKISKFPSSYLDQHAKCIDVSTNKPSIGAIVLDAVSSDFKKILNNCTEVVTGGMLSIIFVP